MLDGNNNKNHKPWFKKRLTLGQRASDLLAQAVGSWAFIISFLFFVIAWMAVNVYLVLSQQWDPYPFILLNFVLSCLAAFQAPVILMSQNRTTERDRQDAKYDYQVNRKAEREIQNMQRDLDEIKAMIKKSYYMKRR